MGRKKRILVIQNNLRSTQFLNNLLSKRYHTSYVQNFEEGLSLLKSKLNFDVIITNLGTSSAKRNQIYSIRKIKKIDPDSIIIVISPQATSTHIQRAIRFGAYDYITKPFNQKQILLAINRGITFRKLIRDLQKEKRELEKKVRERTKELVLIYKIGQEISSTLKLDRVLQSIVDKLSMILGLEICAILLADDSGRLSIRSAQGLDASYLNQTSIKMGEGISGWVWEHKQALLLNDVDSDPRFADRRQERYYMKSLISVPLIVKNKVIGVININNKKSKEPFNDYDLRLVKEIATEAAIAIENANLFKSLQNVYMRTVAALASVIDAKDHYTRSHSENVTRYAVAIAKEMKLPYEEVRSIQEACQLHDLGKIGIHDYVLTKPGKLTPEEWEEVKLHSLRGAEILAPLDFIDGISELVKQHHERYDGKGYPNQCKKEEIRLGARIMAVADTFDAMISERPYRRSYSVKEAIEELKRCRGSQFDPQVVNAFLRVLQKNPHIVP
jgi:HD-GYP domain-containing protein (c-di-GMP phosphodiesterase class II)